MKYEDIKHGVKFFNVRLDAIDAKWCGGKHFTTYIARSSDYSGFFLLNRSKISSSIAMFFDEQTLAEMILGIPQNFNELYEMGVAKYGAGVKVNYIHSNFDNSRTLGKRVSDPYTRNRFFYIEPPHMPDFNDRISRALVK